ncbi:MAG: carboxypeptidase-like regulatory domain-containing protein [Terracidiphilus sp.]
MKCFTRLLCFAFSLLVLTSLTICYGQDVSGMAGEVTDQSGAEVPGAVVTLRNPSTGAKYTQTTNATGFYRFAEIPPGQGYEATFTAKGFNPVVVNGIYLTVGTTRTQNVTLTVGARAEAVEVTATNSEVTIDTTSATIGNTFDVVALNNLPVQQRNDPTALFTMQPGVTDTGAVTGARVDQNYITLDGLDVNDFATGGAVQNNSGSGVSSGFEGSIVGHAPVDSVEEFHATVGGSEAATGPGSGGQFQLVTKSGTNKFHGNVNEYHRDPSLVANSWFSNNSNPVVPRNHLIQNQFGGNIGGPIKKDKAFFFFDFNDSRIISSTFVQRTVPLDTLRNGNVGYINSGGTISYLSPAQVQSLDPAAIGESSTWLSGFTGRFPHSNNQATGDGVNSGGYAFNAPNNDYETNYVGRVDYNLTDKMKIFGRITIARENATNNPNEFAGDPATNPLIDRSYAFAIGHNWVIGDNKTNRVFLGETVQKLSFPNTYNPDGSTFFTFSDGTGPALASSLYLNPNAQARRVPVPMIGDDFSWTTGRHTIQFGGTFKNILAHNTNIADYNTTEIGPGGYTLALCGPTPGDCGAGNPSLRPNDINSSNIATYDYDQAFTYMLGRIAEVSSDFNYNAKGSVLPQLTGDQRYYRYYQTQGYIEDSWKVMPSLTLTYGLNYQWFTVPYETRGLESTEPFTFDQYMQARIQQSALSQTGATAVPLIAYYLGGKANGSSAPPLYKPEDRLMAPHFGFAWNPGFDKKMVINGGAAIVYDRTVINAIQFIQDGDSYLFQQTEPTSLGIPGDPYDSIKTGPRLDPKNGISTVAISAPPTPAPPYEPFVAAGQPYGLQIGSAFNATIDPSLKTPYSMIFNFGLQRSMPEDMVLKVSYAGRLGRRLLGQADANQVLEFPDPVSGQLLSDAFGSVTKQLRAGATSQTVVPQPWFENVMGAGYTSFLVANFGPFVYRGDFGDSVQFFSDTGAPLNVGSAAQFSENTFYGNKGFSAYNAFLLTLQKNLSHGVQYDLNYTFSHSIDNVSFFANSQGDTGIGGIGLICDDIRPRECRASSDYDVKHLITADALYQLPFGQNKMFFSTVPFWTNEIIGGWDLSGITSFHTGQAWGDNSNAFVASYSNDAPGILVGPKSAIATHLTKTPGQNVNIFASQTNAQSAFEGPIGFQIGQRNLLRGPRYFNADLGLGKNFPIYGEKVNLKFRADSFNTFNHPNFVTPASNVYNGLDQQDLTSSQFGNISYTVSPNGNLNNGARVLQLSLRLEF